jgi:hypothetical protein
VVLLLVLSEANVAYNRRNPFRIRFYANSPRKSFRIRFYAKHRGVGASPLADATRPSHRFCSPLCFHAVTNLFSRKPFVFTSIQNPGGRGARPFRFGPSLSVIALPPFRPPKESNPCRSTERVVPVPSQHRLFHCDQFRLQNVGHAAPDHPRWPSALQCRGNQCVQRRVRVSLANEELILRAD